MRTIRRLYFYAVALVSLEVVVWGAVNLLRTVINSQTLVGVSNLLATGLSLVLVGLPVFLLHWGVIQREALRDMEERTSRVRAVFLYAALASLLVPVVYALLALINRPLMHLVGESSRAALFGSQQSASDNLIAIAINLVAAYYYYRILQQDWRNAPRPNFLADSRRLYRYLWLLFGLLLVVSGTHGILRYILYFPEAAKNYTALSLGNGLTLALVGVPLWVFTWSVIQSIQKDEAEGLSLLRLGVLYLLSLIGVVTVLTNTGLVLASALRWALGESNTITRFLNGNGIGISIAIPMGVLWAYYGGYLNREVRARRDRPARDGLRRLYQYILALIGLVAAFTGLELLLGYLVDTLLARVLVGSLRAQLAGGLAALTVGLALWLRIWQGLQREAFARPAAGDTTAGDHARRSVIRKAYLYLVIFVSVVCGMIFAAQIIYQVVRAMLGTPNPELGLDVARLARWLFLFLLLLVYHGWALRQDGKLAHQALASQHAAFPVLILQGADESFALEVTNLLQRKLPRLPVAVHPVATGIPPDEFSGAKAVVIPSDLALNPPEALRLWLNGYDGRRIVVPQEDATWHWLGMPARSQRELAEETIFALRQMAEGQVVRPAPTSNPWMIIGYILAGLFGLQLLFVLISLGVSLVAR